MHKPMRIALICGAVALTGCHENPPAEKSQPKMIAVEPGANAIARTASPPSPPQAPAATSVDNDGAPVIAPVPLTADAARSERGARAMLLAWARGIELREFDQSWNLMGKAAKAQTTVAQFNALLRPLHNITVAVPAGRLEGAAGSSYYTAPATVTGTRLDGTEASLQGEVVLRRVNDVPGATPAQLAWHIVSVTLAPS